MKLTPVVLGCIALASSNIYAEPWVTTDDVFLRAAIDKLVSEGVIRRPVNSYPLMYKGIAQDLASVNESALSEDARFAYRKVQHALTVAKSGDYSAVRVSGNSSPNQLQSFGARNKSEAGIQASAVKMNERVTAKVSVGYHLDASSGKKLDYQGSYLAVLYGNWSISAEKIDKWFGPANDNALLLSNNADPMLGLRLTRLNTNYYGPSFLSFIGPWNFTAFVGKNEQHVDKSNDNLFWAMRFSSTPIAGLEVGINQTAQFDGPLKNHGLSALKDVIFTQNRLDDHGVNEYNQLTSLDIKYSTRLLDQSFSLYGEYAGSNEVSILPQDTMLTLGGEHFLGGQDYLVKSYIEFSDTSSQCDFITEGYHCQYQHPYYLQDYTHLTEQIGPSINKNVESITLASHYQTTKGYAGYIKLRQLDYTAKSAKITEQIQLEVGYQQALFNGLIKLTSGMMRETKDNETNNEFMLSGSWEYRF